MTDWGPAVREYEQEKKRNEEAGVDFLNSDRADAAIAELKVEVERINKVNTLHYQKAQLEHSMRLEAEAEVERLKEAHATEAKYRIEAEHEVERLTWMLNKAVHLTSDEWYTLDIDDLARRWEEWYNKTDKEESLG